MEDNLFRLHYNLKQGIYPETHYAQFKVHDPKPRLISKASIECRLLHHAIYRVLYPAFDQTFIYDSYSCRNDKGTHKAFERVVTITRQVSKNYTQPCWALKFDIKKFFDSVDHVILFNLLAERIEDRELLHLLDNIIGGFAMREGRGMPLGNLTSQLFANVYMDPLDKFVKHQLKAPHYLRYADDMILLGDNPSELMGYFIEINSFAKQFLKLDIHPQKISLRKLTWGIDFVGYVALPFYNLPRQRTLKRMMKKLDQSNGQTAEIINASLQSYLGYCQHAQAYEVSRNLLALAWTKIKRRSSLAHYFLVHL